MTYQLAELSDAAPGAGEFQEVEHTYKRLSQAQSLREVVAASLLELTTTTALSQGLKQLEGIDDDHPTLQGARETLT